MSAQSGKWSLLCFGFILMAVASWKHFYDLLQWSNELSATSYVPQKHKFVEEVHVYRTEANCGLRRVCRQNSFSIYLSTGLPGTSSPKLCISGSHLLPESVETGSNRGLIGAVVEPSNFSVVSVRNFDTYLYNKTKEIKEWLNAMLDNDILVIFTSDEASARLSFHSRKLFNEIGSGKVQNLQYRSQWYMITQKGTTGFSTYEKITYSKKKTWGDTIEFKGCIPRKIPKKLTSADEPLKENRKRVQFCQGKTTEEYKAFCNEPRFEIIMPALLTNKSLVGNYAYTLPVFIFASRSLEILISSLDNMIHQPGVVVSLVTVLYENNQTDVPSLAKIYGMHSNKTTFGQTFDQRLKQTQELCQKMYPNKRHLIVLDSEVLPSPDFLFFIAQTLPTLDSDNTVKGISAWSSNCYEHNGNVHLAYRIFGTPKYGAVIPAFTNNTGFFGEIIAPDVPRVQGMEICHLPSLDQSNFIKRPQDLTRNRYLQKLIMLQNIGQRMKVDEILKHCSDFSYRNDTYVMYVNSNETEHLPKILRCLGVLGNHFGEFAGVIQLFVKERILLIINNYSPLYKSRPIAIA